MKQRAKVEPCSRHNSCLGMGLGHGRDCVQQFVEEPSGRVERRQQQRNQLGRQRQQQWRHEQRRRLYDQLELRQRGQRDMRRVRLVPPGNHVLRQHQRVLRGSRVQRAHYLSAHDVQQQRRAAGRRRRSQRRRLHVPLRGGGQRERRIAAALHERRQLLGRSAARRARPARPRATVGPPGTMAGETMAAGTMAERRVGEPPPTAAAVDTGNHSSIGGTFCPLTFTSGVDPPAPLKAALANVQSPSWSRQAGPRRSCRPRAPAESRPPAPRAPARA